MSESFAMSTLDAMATEEHRRVTIVEGQMGREYQRTHPLALVICFFQCDQRIWQEHLTIRNVFWKLTLRSHRSLAPLLWVLSAPAHHGGEGPVEEMYQQMGVRILRQERATGRTPPGPTHYGSPPPSTSYHLPFLTTMFIQTSINSLGFCSHKLLIWGLHHSFTLPTTSSIGLSGAPPGTLIQQHFAWPPGLSLKSWRKFHGPLCICQKKKRETWD